MQNKAKPMPSMETLKAAFECDVETGKLLRKRASRGYKIGEAAGTKMPSGHVVTFVDGKRYLVHRIVYFMATGNDPGEDFVDHINGVPDDNRPTNLRLANRIENGRHKVKLAENNKSGHRNVSWCATWNRWHVSLTVGNKRIQKKFKSLPEAAAFAEMLRCQHYGSFKGLTP